MLDRALAVAEPGAAQALLDALVPLGAPALCLPSYEEAWAALAQARGTRDLLLVDLDLPGGLAFIRQLRGSESGRRAAVIALSAGRGEPVVVEAFKAGIDDFLVKPWDARELAVRCRVVVRRRARAPQPPLSIGGVSIEPSQRLCRVRGRRVALQPREFALLDALMRREGRVLTRAYLLEVVWGMDAEAQTRAVDVMVSRVRRKLGDAGRRIETVSKLGYCFRARALGA